MQWNMAPPTGEDPALAAMLAGAGGCSLLSIKSPERPLSARDMNARILTREYSAHFIAAVEKCADDITVGESDTGVVTSIRFVGKSGAATIRRRCAATQITPPTMESSGYLGVGDADEGVYGRGQHRWELCSARIRKRCGRLPTNKPTLRTIWRTESSHPRISRSTSSFVEAYSHRYPLEDLSFTRTSIVELWSRESGSEVKLVDSLGDHSRSNVRTLADRMQIYGEALPSQALWKTELALRGSGYSQVDIRVRNLRSWTVV